MIKTIIIANNCNNLKMKRFEIKIVLVVAIFGFDAAVVNLPATFNVVVVALFDLVTT